MLRAHFRNILSRLNVILAQMTFPRECFGFAAVHPSSSGVCCSELVSSANEWLARNRDRCVRCCEAVQHYGAKADDVKPENMVEVTPFAENVTSYRVKGLR